MKSAPPEPFTGEKQQLLDAGASQEEMRGNASQHDECTPPSVSNTVARGSNKRPRTENGSPWKCISLGAPGHMRALRPRRSESSQLLNPSNLSSGAGRSPLLARGLKG
jgi:hypothetical protein